MDGSERPLISVIVPTFNRKASLLRTLESLVQQGYPVERLEVIVVDDGGDDGTETVAQRSFPFPLHYVRQENQGAAAARNQGARQSHGALLIFVDDDIRLLPHTVERLAAHADIEKTILLGTLTTPTEILASSPFARLVGSTRPAESGNSEFQQVPFQNCMTGLLGVRREDFFALGMFQDPTGGWPNWDDVEFGYRAHQAGYRLLRVDGAVAEHWDYALSSLSHTCQRLERAAFSGATLLRRYPTLGDHLPMFADKGPIAWRQDPPGLICRKLVRQIASSAPVMGVMKQLARVLERRAPENTALRLLYRWIGSGYIYRGYRRGVREITR